MSDTKRHQLDAAIVFLRGELPGGEDEPQSEWSRKWRRITDVDDDGERSLTEESRDSVRAAVRVLEAAKKVDKNNAGNALAIIGEPLIRDMRSVGEEKYRRGIRDATNLIESLPEGEA